MSATLTAIDARTEATPRRLDARLSRAMDQSSYGRELLDLALRFTHADCRRWELAQWNKGYVPTAICDADREAIASDAVCRFVETVAAMDPSEDGTPGFPATATDRRRLCWKVVQFALLDYLRARATQGQGLEDIPEPGTEPETEEERAERERVEFEAVRLIARELPDEETKRTALAVAYTPTQVDAAAKLGIVKSTVTKRLKRMQRHFETPAEELCRCICEALETVRTGRPAILPPVGIPARTELLFGVPVTVRS